jgi:hypothetical protein
MNETTMRAFERMLKERYEYFRNFGTMRATATHSPARMFTSP